MFVVNYAQPLPFMVDDFALPFRNELIALGLPDPQASAPEITITPQHTTDFTVNLEAAQTGISAVTTDLADFSTTVSDITATLPNVDSGLSSSTGLDPVNTGNMTVSAMIAPMVDNVAMPFAYGKAAVGIITSLSSSFPSFTAVAALLVAMWIGIGWMIFMNLIGLLITSVATAMRAYAEVAGVIK
jgi:hypothetical protein